MLRKHLPTVLRLALTVALLLFLVHAIGPDRIVQLLGSLQPSYFVVVFALKGLDALLRGYNWSVLLRCKGLEVPLRAVLYAHLTGGFFGTFLPSSLGVDVARLVTLSRRTPARLGASASSLVMLNLLGVTALGILALGAASVFLLRGAAATLAVPVLLMAVAVLVLVAAVVLGRGAVGRILGRWQRYSLVKRLRDLTAAFDDFYDAPGALWRVLAVSFVSQFIAMVLAFTISEALDGRAAFAHFVLLMPVVTLSRLVPVSVAGLGAEQGIFVYLFGQVGVAAEEAFLISVLLSTSAILFTLTGGVIYVLDSLTKLRQRPDATT